MHNLLHVYSFFLTLGPLKAGFQKISGIGESMEPEYIYEGGQCRPYPIQGTKNKAGRITFEKGHGYLNPFLSKNGFTAGSRISLPCSIIITDKNNKPLRIFAFDSGMLVSWEISELDALSGNVLIDKAVIEHSGIYELTKL